VTAQRFRRSRLGRWADAATLDRLEAEWGDLSAAERVERNRFIDEHSDAEIRAYLGEVSEDDRKAARAAKRAAKKAAAAENAVDETEPSGEGEQAET